MPLDVCLRAFFENSRILLGYTAISLELCLRN